MLHSTFWHHGASDLSLPIWWAASSIFDDSNGSGSGSGSGSSSGTAGADGPAARHTAAPTSKPHGGVLLDFLYPEKTLALLKQLSVARSDASESRRRQVRRIPLRHFSTHQSQQPHNESAVTPEVGHGAEDGRQAVREEPYAEVGQGVKDESEAILHDSPEEVGQGAKTERDAVLHDSHAIKEIYKLLRTRPPGRQELAWALYAAIPEAHLARGGHWMMRKDLLEYLTANDEAAVPSHVLQLFGELPVEQRRPSSYRAAIVAYIALRMVGPAIELLEQAHRDDHFLLPHIGADVILQRTVLDEQWDLSLRVFRVFLRQNPVIDRLPIATAIRFGNTLPDLWTGLTSSQGLQERLLSCLDHVREYKHELRSTKEREEVLSLFIMSFAPQVIDQLFRNHAGDVKYISKYLQRLFATLLDLHLPTSVCYENTILRMLDLPHYQTDGVNVKLWLDDIYEHYRQACLDSSAKPSQKVIRNIVVHRSQHETIARAQDAIQDLRIFYPNQRLRPGLLRFLIHFCADHGDVKGVEEFFNHFKAHYKDQVDLKLVSALPFAFARRADIDGTMSQFNRIQDEFALVPDTACWNILLLAYVRADDLDGALECFNNCLESGNSPDKYTFGSLLDLCAERGDVEAFEALFSRAKNMGVAMTQDVQARSGYVQAFLNAGDPEGAVAIAQGMLNSWRNGTLRGSLTHTWNLLIQHHALNRDIASSRQCYKEMIDNRIPLDSWTYGSLMRALIEVKQSNAAYRILKKTMPENNLRVHALHYAIVMTGLLKEGGGQIDLAFEVYEQMNKRQIQQTLSSRESSIALLGTSGLQKLKKRGAKHPNYRLEEVEAAVDDMLVEAVQGQIAHREPKHSRYVDAANYGATPQAYYGLLMSLYTTRGAYKVVKKLLDKANNVTLNVDNYLTPMTLIVAAMNAHQKAGEHAEVARYWGLARTTASKLTTTFHQVMQPKSPTPEHDSLIDPTVRERFEQSRISNNRRHILFKASRAYVRSLIDPTNPNPNAIQEAQRTMRDLLVNGYTVDNYTWNEFTVALAQRGRLVDAFTICEEFLMPQFPGWRHLHPNYVRKDQQGYGWMELRHYEMRRSSILPRYNTLVVLATEFHRVRVDERNGVGYDPVSGTWTREVLEKVAPMTIRAIETMPRTNDRLQRKYFDLEQ
jgi:pentatricopeptide repeat-containing protein PET309